MDGEEQDWLYLFKNETHNHPTEIYTLSLHDALPISVVTSLRWGSLPGIVSETGFSGSAAPVTVSYTHLDVYKRQELVLFFGIVYIWDAMTVVIQRAYFKAKIGRAHV